MGPGLGASLLVGVRVAVDAIGVATVCCHYACVQRLRSVWYYQ